MSWIIGDWLHIFIILEMSKIDDQDWLSPMHYPNRAHYTLGRPTISLDKHGLSCHVDGHSSKMHMMTLSQDPDSLYLWEGRGLFIEDPHLQNQRLSHEQGVVAQVIELYDSSEIDNNPRSWVDVYLSMKKFLSSRGIVPPAITKGTCKALQGSVAQR